MEEPKFINYDINCYVKKKQLSILRQAFLEFRTKTYSKPLLELACQATNVQQPLGATNAGATTLPVLTRIFGDDDE